MIFFQVAPSPPVVGDRAPDVEFRRQDGSALRLASLRGKIVVLEFTALDCPPCRELAPKLEALAAEQPDIVFLTISTDRPEATPRLLALRGKDAKTVFLQDAYDADRSKMAVWKFGNVAVPTMFVIGRDGTMASRLMQGGIDDLPRLKFRIEWARKRPETPR